MAKVHLITLPILLTFSTPLGVLAIFTTIFATCILVLQVILVYLELAFLLLPHYFLEHLPLPQAVKAISAPPSRRGSDAVTPYRHKRSRRLSTTSIGSAGPSLNHSNLRASASAVSLPVNNNPARDFEGVGGWRLAFDSDSDTSEEQWTRINSRFTLPAESPTWRHHRRNGTGGSFTGGHTPYYGGATTPTGVWSPNTKRLRTAGLTPGLTPGDGYFRDVPPRQSFEGQSERPGNSGNTGGSVNVPGASSTASPSSSRSSGLGGGLMMKGR